MRDIKDIHAFVHAYLEGELPEAERLAFEQGLQSNAELKEELQHQQAVVEAVKQQRHLELKAALDNVAVGPAITAWQWVAGGAAAVAVAVLGYFAVVPQAEDNAALIDLATAQGVTLEQQLPAIPNAPTQEALAQGSEVNTDNPAPTIPSAQQAPTQENGTALVAANDGATSNNEQQEANTTNDEEVVVTEEPMGMPEVLNPEAGVDPVREEVNPTRPEDLLTNRIEQSSVDVQLIEHDKYGFHYRFYNGRLFLYGTFEKAPYELYELKSPQGRNLYMAYEGKYYYINMSQEAIAPLNALRNPKLLKQLEILKNNK